MNRPPQHLMPWTKEEETKLKELIFKTEKSSTEIGRILQRTRPAIAGKMRVLGLLPEEEKYYIRDIGEAADLALYVLRLKIPEKWKK